MNDTKPCIACSEDIKSHAKLCKHCNTRQDDKAFENAELRQDDEAFDPVAYWSQDKSKSRSVSSNDTSKFFAGVVVIAVAVLAGLYLFNGQSFGFTSLQTNEGTSGSSSSGDVKKETETSETIPKVDDVVLRDCISYQTNFDATSDYRDFLWYEGQDYLVGNPTVHNSDSFSAAWDEVFVELDQTGAISWPIFVGELAVICYEEADYSLVLP